MPIEVTYPGVYVEELPSGQHTITPVATNICAFVGRAPIGDTENPVTIFNYGDFTRAFGGLKFDYPLSYAVQDFFDNGGSQAIIARLFEPSEGDGVARLKFPPAPPVLPQGWLLDGDAKAGDSQVAVSEPTGGSEGEPDVGMTLTFNGDSTQTYLVTAYAQPNPAKKLSAMVTLAPALRRGFRKCTALTFDHGGSPSGWMVESVSGTTVTLTGGSGIPELGDNFTFAGDPTVYTAISEPKVSGTDPAALQVVITLTPKPGAMGGVVATVTDPVPLPMPAGWEIETFAKGAKSAGTITLINGSGAPLIGDQFTIGDSPDVYVVTGFTAATAKAPANILAFESLSGDALDSGEFCLCCAPKFDRVPPADVGIKTGAKVGETSFVAARSAATSGTIDIGDTFQLEGDTTVYSVRYIDATTGTIYFLPGAKTAFGGSTGITFAPPLALRAANPGEWGNYLTAEVNSQGITDKTAKQFKEYDLEQGDLFNLTLIQKDARGRPVKSESFLNLSVKTTGKAANFPNRIDRVLESSSALARVDQLAAVPPPHGASAKGIGGNDGQYLSTETYLGNQDAKTGLHLLEKVPIFNLLCIPPDRRMLADVPDGEQDLDSVVRQAAAHYCTDRRAFYIVDPPIAWKNKARQGQLSAFDPQDVGITGENDAGIDVARNAAVYFPRIWKEDLLMKSRPALFAPSGAIAGVMAATDVGRGVWKAPAGVDAGLANVTDLEFNLTDDENGQLNPLGINCLRKFPIVGPVVWGARTLHGADQLEDDYKYISVRRLTLFIEDSLYRGTQWAVFEPNNEALWSSLRLSCTSFLADLARQGAFYNYSVACDASTTTQADIDNGKVNILVKIAPVKPAEFVILQIQQVAGAKPG
jgi:phage tail sheath protein FI